MTPPPLNPEQIEQFLQEGHLVLSSCFTQEESAELLADAWEQLGYDPSDPETWEKPLAFLFPTHSVPFRKFAPEAWNAVCQLVGGEDRLAHPEFGVGQWVINFRRGRDEPWEPPSPRVGGWHIDGTFFRHFLDSPEQGLLIIPIFSEIEHRGGGTFLACDSVPVVARHLEAHPEGLRLEEIDFPGLIAQCREFREVTGSPGDIVLIHPFMLHNFSQNHSGKPRFITNLCVGLQEPMRFHREAPADYSPVERAVLRGLGVENLDFHPQAPRERFDPNASKK